MTFLALIAIIFFGFAVYNLTCAFVDIPTKKTSQSEYNDLQLWYFNGHTIRSSTARYFSGSTLFCFRIQLTSPVHRSSCCSKVGSVLP